jgi:putative heme iron utilization protein
VDNSQSVSQRARDARALLQSRGFGVLCTQSKRAPGYPFGSIVNFALDDTGRPIFVLSGLAVHTKNLQEDSRASLVAYGEGAETDVLGTARMTAMGDIHPVLETELSAARNAFFARHPGAEPYMGFADFAVYRMEVMDVYYVGGFGMMGWVMAADYRAAR